MTPQLMFVQIPWMQHWVGMQSASFVQPCARHRQVVMSQ